ncbi:cupin domain-containing protein [Vibrio kanaloae]|uniref:Cupin domain-containing protein n=2 Tax=Gammaproteobacteria TaxID=1236 RepID=A0A4V6WWE6_9VIBR|nr:cupin domain-containing protein [Vibrio kanaloae]TKF25028.1 cupin domain-containing protein [Vibrio kanaloae]
MYQLSFSMPEFLENYWHKKPTILKGGFQNFVDPISPEELAGLSMEEEVDSRFVSNLDNKWTAEHGPFTEEKFGELTESHWQLVVQAANHWHQGANQLTEAFQQLPNWLFDDLMICYSAPEGGVGPHIDQYDVFIIQGQGKRQWKVGAKDIGQYTESVQASALRQIEGFEPIIDETLEPGDILYIPPGFPHEGNTLEPSMSYSIGYRSPKEQELISNFADFVLAHDMGDVHLHDPELKTQDGYGKIRSSDLDNLTDMLKSALEEPETISDFMGCLLSQSRHQLDIVAPDPLWTQEEIAQHLESEGEIHRVSGLKALYHENESNTAYINGEVVKVDEADSSLLNILCDEAVINSAATLSPSGVTVVTELVNKGYWFIED